MLSQLMQSDEIYNAKLKEELNKFSALRRRKTSYKTESFKLKLTIKQKMLLSKLAFENYMNMTEYIIAKCNLLQADFMSLDELTPNRTIDFK